jgi:hypothetical protein
MNSIEQNKSNNQQMRVSRSTKSKSRRKRNFSCGQP